MSHEFFGKRDRRHRQPQERPRINTIDLKKSVKTDSQTAQDRRAFKQLLAILIPVATRKACMKPRYWMIAGTALLLVSCRSNRTRQAIVQPSPQAFVQPVVTAKPPTATIKVPGMIPTTDSKTLLKPVAVSSTRDPFAAPTTDLQATVIPRNAIAQRRATITAKSSVGSTPVTLSHPPYNPMPQTVSVHPLPTIPVTPPPPTRTPVADGIAFTGVIQAGNQISAIVEDTDGTVRSVQAGEKLANGEVTVKRINLDADDPAIVLVQNGVEFIKTVGKSEAL